MDKVTYRLSDLPARLRAKIIVHPVSGCWIGQWKPDHRGYIRIWWQGKAQYLHRVVYRLLAGEITDDGLDHVRANGCISKACCFPGHLDDVPSGINTRRSPTSTASVNAAKTHCPAGHELVPGNLVKNRLPYRICLTCYRKSCRDAGRRKRAPQAAKRAERRAAAVRLQAEGLSLREIGRRLGVKHDTVASDLARSATVGP